MPGRYLVLICILRKKDDDAYDKFIEVLRLKTKRNRKALIILDFNPKMQREYIFYC